MARDQSWFQSSTITTSGAGKDWAKFNWPRVDTEEGGDLGGLGGLMESLGEARRKALHVQRVPVFYTLRSPRTLLNIISV